jgi:hypothetical protein
MDGVLGGFGFLSEADIAASHAFLAPFLGNSSMSSSQRRIETNAALGIGSFSFSSLSLFLSLFLLLFLFFSSLSLVFVFLSFFLLFTLQTDCGAGIGRVTQYLLLDLFDRVDLVEPNVEFLNTAKSIFDNASHPKGHR